MMDTLRAFFHIVDPNTVATFLVALISAGRLLLAGRARPAPGTAETNVQLKLDLKLRRKFRAASRPRRHRLCPR